MTSELTNPDQQKQILTTIAELTERIGKLLVELKYWKNKQHILHTQNPRSLDCGGLVFRFTRNDSE